MNNQEPIESKIFREQQRQNAMFRKDWKCDLCGRTATQMHELLFRSATLNNVEARRLSFQQEICSILCEGCHSRAHSPEITVKLLMRNSQIYGRDAVNEALHAVQDHLRGKLNMWLPEEVDG